MTTNALKLIEPDSVPIFLHMTKTAGGTLKSAIQTSLGRNVKYIFGRDIDDSVFTADANTKLYFGHSQFGVHESLNVVPTYYTFIRHPFRRTVSHYYHLYNIDMSEVGNKIRQQKDINEFFEDSEHWEFNNFMCRVISGFGEDKTYDSEIIYETAKNNIIQYFNYVGFQEFFPESVAIMAGMLGCDIPVEENINIGAYDRSSISDATHAKIASMNEYDMCLYKFCVDRFL